MTVETREVEIQYPKKIAEQKIEQFATRVLPDIFERTKASGHFRDMKTHELISPSEMSSNIEEDMKQYHAFTLQLHTLFTQSEKNDISLLRHSEEKIRDLFENYGKRREAGKTHYFVEYLKNKSAQILQEIQKVILEISGKEVKAKKRVVSIAAHS
jgi:hypothetical protein